MMSTFCTPKNAFLSENLKNQKLKFFPQFLLESSVSRILSKKPKVALYARKMFCSCQKPGIEDIGAFFEPPTPSLVNQL